MNKWTKLGCVWLAQGFGIGRIPILPGTFGSVPGVLWFALLLQAGNLWVFLGGTALGLGLSVWICGKAAEVLNDPDPGSVVLDEIAAVPLCFLPLLAVPWIRAGDWPVAANFFHGIGWRETGMAFALFRIFDWVKPWPINVSQNLPGGWGITIDDFLAGVYTAVLMLVWIW